MLLTSEKTLKGTFANAVDSKLKEKAYGSSAIHVWLRWKYEKEIYKIFLLDGNKSISLLRSLP